MYGVDIYAYFRGQNTSLFFTSDLGFKVSDFVFDLVSDLVTRLKVDLVTILGSRLKVDLVTILVADLVTRLKVDLVSKLYNIHSSTVPTAILPLQLCDSSSFSPVSMLATKKATTVRADVGAAAAGSSNIVRKTKKPQNYNFLVFR
jgi:hypothetical protein